MESLLLSCLLGSVTGVVLGLTGAGGVIIAVPLLIFGLHLNIAQAVPVALLAACMSATVGALIGLRQGKVRYRAAGLIALAGSLVSPAGLWFAQRLPHEPLVLLFAVVLAYVAINMLIKSKHAGHDIQTDLLHHHPSPEMPCMTGNADGRLIWTWSCARALTLSGSLAGFLSGLLGVGGGFVVVPALKKYTFLDMQSILATSLAVIALISAVGAVSSVFMGAMHWTVATPFAGGALVGMLAGYKLASRFSGTSIQKGFAWLALFVAVGMVVRLLILSV
ncbi:MAG: sulfite exporter TauE/SafE family protein [Nitrosomonas sp.]|nr:sulfite exporter TauE/SafE family protein [Nitrosomonas sp.]